MIKTTIPGTSHWLEASAFDAYIDARLNGCPKGITSAGRTRAQQAALYARYLADKARGRKPPRMAAKPGTSKHELGTALDLPEPARSWMHEHGARFGWVGNCVAGEPWHFEFVGRSTPKPQPPATIPALKEIDMRLIKEQGNATVYEVTPVTITAITSGADLTGLVAIYGGVAELASPDFQAIVRSVQRQQAALAKALKG